MTKISHLQAKSLEGLEGYNSLEGSDGYLYVFKESLEDLQDLVGRDGQSSTLVLTHLLTPV